jgi:hypothetical protein
MVSVMTTANKLRIGWATNELLHMPANAEGKTAYFPGGSAWYRMFLPAKWLRERGHHCPVGRLVFDKKLGIFGVTEDTSPEPDPETFDFDLPMIVLQRWMFDEMPEDIKRARSSGQVVVQGLGRLV